MSILVTMRVKVKDFEGVRKAVAKHNAHMKAAGCHWSKVYRAEKDPNDVLFLMEWESHAAFEKSGDSGVADDFNALVDPLGDWEDVVWQLSDAEQI